MNNWSRWHWITTFGKRKTLPFKSQTISNVITTCEIDVAKTLGVDRTRIRTHGLETPSKQDFVCVGHVCGCWNLHVAYVAFVASVTFVTFVASVTFEPSI